MFPILEGDRFLQKGCMRLAKFTVRVKSAKKGVEKIQVTFELDVNGGKHKAEALHLCARCQEAFCYLHISLYLSDLWGVVSLSFRKVCCL